MSAIPEKLIAEAGDVADDLFGGHHPTVLGWLRIRNAVATALRARDERAASIALAHDGDGSLTNVGRVIAGAILTYPEQSNAE